MNEILEFYASLGRDLPEELEADYAQLTVLENPDIDIPQIDETPKKGMEMTPYKEMVLKMVAAGILESAIGNKFLATIPFAQHWACGILGIPTLDTEEDLHIFTRSQKPPQFTLFHEPERHEPTTLVEFVAIHRLSKPPLCPRRVL